jgi:S-adenosylmethionine:tRNA ribosyltransferase-isomerase
LKTSDFDYSLPQSYIAQYPIEPRDSSRLLVLDRQTGEVENKRFRQILDYVKKGDILVFNSSRVIPARLYGRKDASGGKVEILLLRRRGDGNWEALLKPGKRLKEGDEITVEKEGIKLTVLVMSKEDDGIRVVKIDNENQLAQVGVMPLPPYIKEELKEAERYQTVYAKLEGSVAAPTAGLHFTRELMKSIAEKGAQCLFVNLHIGLDTFRPVKEEDPKKHPTFREYGIISPQVAETVSKAKEENRRVICVGTTSTRLMEYAAQKSKKKPLEPFSGWVDLLILPGYSFKIMDAMITNFHLPRTTLLMLVSAFAGIEKIKNAYSEAIKEKYRFYSFGDAMLIK